MKLCADRVNATSYELTAIASALAFRELQFCACLYALMERDCIPPRLINYPANVEKFTWDQLMDAILVAVSPTLD